MTFYPCATVGVEIELLAPVGSNRKRLAELIARRINGEVQTFFHIDSEPSQVKGKPIFYHLTQAYQVVDTHGNFIAKCVDDITLQRDLDKSVSPKTGWFRILSDDIRLLRLLLRHTNANTDIHHSLIPLGKLFGTQPESTTQGIYRLMDEHNASLAMSAPLPGERERACELVTAPLARNDHDTLPLLLDCAKELEFTLPNEGATHLHFDGKPFCSTPGLIHTMNLLHTQHKTLRELLQTNPYCRRLGPWSDALMDTINDDDFATLSWEEARQRLVVLNPGKYCDINIRNLVLGTPDKHTLEIRNLPPTLNAEAIFAAIDGFQALFAHTLNQQGQACGHPDQQQLPASVVATFKTFTNHLAQPVS